MSKYTFSMTNSQLMRGAPVRLDLPVNFFKGLLETILRILEISALFYCLTMDKEFTVDY